MTQLSFDPTEEVFARSQAIEQDPSLATPEGRAMREVLTTLGYIALGEHPRTVLGGIIMSGRFNVPAVEEGTGRSLPEMAAIGVFNLDTPDGVFPTRQILDDLIKAGFVEHDEPPEDSVEALRKGDDYHGPTYRLRAPLALAIERLNPERDRAEGQARRARIEASQARPRSGGLVRRVLKRR